MPNYVFKCAICMTCYQSNLFSQLAIVPNWGVIHLTNITDFEMLANAANFFFHCLRKEGMMVLAMLNCLLDIII